MSPTLSVALDLVRFLAACAVVTSHAFGPMFCNFGSRGAAGLGVFAVGTFFVLSGFVIQFSVENSQPNFTKYLVARLARMYSVLVPALLVTFALSLIGARFLPTAYHRFGLGASDVDWGFQSVSKQFGACLLFLNESVWFRNDLKGNDVVWSLGYEFPYYLIFAISIFINNRTVAWLALICAAMLYGLPILILFPAWLSGALLYRYLGKKSISTIAASVALLFIPATLALTALSNSRWLSFIGSGKLEGTSGSILKLIVQNRSSGFPLLYGGAVSMTALIIAVVGFESKLTGISTKAGPFIRKLSGGTFAIYLFHYPILCLLCALPLYHRQRLADIVVTVLVTLGLTLILAQFTESRKEGWTSALNRVVAIIGGPRN